MTARRATLLTASLVLACTVAYGDGDAGSEAPETGTATYAGNEPDAVVPADAPGGSGEGAAPDDAGTDAPAPLQPPAWFPGAATPADEVLTPPGLSAPVRVVLDGETEPDIARAQGYVTAQNRLVQMFTLLWAASGSWRPCSGPTRSRVTSSSARSGSGSVRQMAKWVKNEAPLVPFTVEDVLARKARIRPVSLTLTFRRGGCQRVGICALRTRFLRTSPRTAACSAR